MFEKPDDSGLTINRALFLITSLSPSAKETIDLELYRESADSDMATDQYILEESFVNLTKDLSTIGINLNTDYTQLLEPMSELFEFLHLCQYLLPNTLYEMIKHQPKLKQLIHDTVVGNLGNHETVLETYLSELAGLNGAPAFVLELKDIADTLYGNVSQTELFTDYLRNLLDLSSDQKLAMESDDEIHQKFRSHVRDLLNVMAEAIPIYVGKPIYDDLITLFNIIVKDLLSFDNFHSYSYIFLNRSQDLPDDLVDNYKKRWYQYFVSHPWCYQHYEIRNTKPSDVQCVMMKIFISTLTNSGFVEETSIPKFEDMEQPFTAFIATV